MKIEGDLEKVETLHINKIIEVLKENEFTEDAKVTLQAVGQKGDNFTACVKRILVEDKGGKTLQMIAKIAPSQEIERQMVNTELLFANEVIMYTKVMPQLAKLQHGLDIPEDEKLWFPKCYGVICEKPNEFILLEDLKQQDFEMRDRMVSLTNEEIKIVLKRVAALHSLSFVLNHKEPESFYEFGQMLRNLWANIKEETRQMFGMIETGVAELLEKEEYKIRTRGMLSRLVENSSELDKVEKESKYSVIIHGDCWTNNLMFKLKQAQPIDCILIDYQVSRVSSPALELLYLIFNCTDREIQSKNFYDWLDYYHKALDDSLVNFGLKTAMIYPREKLDADLRRYGKVAYGMSLLLANSLGRESSETIDINEESLLMIEEMKKNNDVLGLSVCKEETVLKLKKRLNDVCASFIGYGYI